MTNAQYTNLWTTQLVPHVPDLTAAAIPSFDQHLIRENQLEDYLDIFRGVNTRPNRGNDMVIPYRHPFFNADGSPKLKDKPCIKYILVGEAAPLMKTSDTVEGCLIRDGDKGKGKTYFYDITHLRNTSYLSSPLIAFGCPTKPQCPENKIESLLCLAEKGVVLLDLFPFSIEYTTPIRTILNSAGVTNNFWNAPTNVWNLQDRLIRINSLLCKEWDLCLLAPPVISQLIIAHFPPMALSTPGLHPGTFRETSPNILRTGNSDWKKLTIDSSNFNVNARLISEAFDL